MRILFATNLTEPSSVTGEVERLARQLNAELFVLHVISPAPATAVPSIDPMTGLRGFAPYTLYDPQLEATMEEAEEHAFRDFLRNRFTIPVHAGLRKGDPSQVVLEDADEHRIDLLIIGKRKHGRLERLFVGSTAQDLIKHSKRPVLVMPSDS